MIKFVRIGHTTLVPVCGSVAEKRQGVYFATTFILVTSRLHVYI
jgi:hypothetical protein